MRCRKNQLIYCISHLLIDKFDFDWSGWVTSTCSITDDLCPRDANVALKQALWNERRFLRLAFRLSALSFIVVFNTKVKYQWCRLIPLASKYCGFENKFSRLTLSEGRRKMKINGA